ncbi:hypothetical protein ACH436_14920 [Isoptericola sp. NPDC019693]|uniref:hypothetical protein n=1 Tax=Isoptericola sp. NPDC019693 TaxID=3364009 RepID=UPI00378FF08B
MSTTASRTTWKRRTRTALAALAGLAAAGALALVGAAPAQADVLDATCTGSVEHEYIPGLKLVAAPVDLDERVEYSCLGLSEPAVGTFQGGGGYYLQDVTYGCLSVGLAQHNETIAWTGFTGTNVNSVLSGTAVTTNVAGSTVVTVTGTVTSGMFAGDAFVRTTTTPNITGALACLSSTGLTESSGTTVLEITSVP